MKKKTILQLIWIIMPVLAFSVRAPASEPIRIALVVPRTGFASYSNVDFCEGVDLAVKEINGKGGVLGRPLKIIKLDNKSTLQGSKRAAAEAAELDVAAVVGAVWSSHSIAMAPILQKAGIPMLTPSSTNPKVTLAGDYIFRACFTDDFAGKVAAGFAYRDMNAKRAAILKNVSNHYSMDLAGFFKQSFEDRGGQVVYEGKYKEKTSDFGELLEPLRACDADVVFLPGYAQDSALIMKQAASLEIRARFLGGDGWFGKMHEIGGKSIEGAYYCAQWHTDLPSPGTRKFVGHYQKNHGKRLRGYIIPLAYDAIMLLSRAIADAGSTDRGKIRDALASIRGYRGVTGEYTFDEFGDPKNKPVVILKFENGNSVFVKTITSGE